jgi:hypothetical protein
VAILVLDPGSHNHAAPEALRCRPATQQSYGSAGYVQDRVRVLGLGLQRPDGFTGRDG